jgi:hypothetical protein
MTTDRELQQSIVELRIVTIAGVARILKYRTSKAAIRELIPGRTDAEVLEELRSREAQTSKPERSESLLDYFLHAIGLRRAVA